MSLVQIYIYIYNHFQYCVEFSRTSICPNPISVFFTKPQSMLPLHRNIRMVSILIHTHVFRKKVKFDCMNNRNTKFGAFLPLHGLNTKVEL